MRRFERLARDLGSAAEAAGRVERPGGAGSGGSDPAFERRLRALEAAAKAPAPSTPTPTDFRAQGGL